MVTDPYRVLGVPRNATKDEIKKAYRKKAKECHPDFHPDDPKASERMNEVNEAYDMLMNPEKYANRRTQQSNPYSGGYSGSGSSYGPYGGYGSYGGYHRDSYGTGDTGGTGQGSSGNSGGWYGNFGGFDFEDLFNSFSGATYTRPVPEAGDGPEVRNAIYYMNNGRYQQAVNTLLTVQSGQRNARWFYLCGLAYHGYGNNPKAVENMTRAVQMEPNNGMYHMLLNRYRQESQYSSQRGFYGFGGEEQRGRTYTSQTSCLGMLLRGLFFIMMVRFFFAILQMLLYGGRLF